MTEITDYTGDMERMLKGKGYAPAIMKLASPYNSEWSIYINHSDILSFGKAGIEIADMLNSDPVTAIEYISSAVVRIAGKRGEDIANKVCVRIVNLPRRKAIRRLRADDINRFLSIEGVLRRVSEVKPKLLEAVFVCRNCDTQRTRVRQVTDSIIEPSHQCQHCRRETNWQLDVRESMYEDTQLILIQEYSEGLKASEQPYSMEAELTGDLCGRVNPGNRIILNGMMRPMRQTRKDRMFDTLFEANSIEMIEKEYDDISISDDDEQKILAMSREPGVVNRIARSIAPTIYGNESVKEAIALQLFGGVAKTMPDRTRIRGDIHVFLLGDPGIAKSQLLKYIVKLSPRGIFVVGPAASKVGLTASAVKDANDQWALEAGALVLADGGIVAIDEFDKMSDTDRGAIHECMEQQEIDIAKAGIVATLKTRCAVLAAANPKTGRFDSYEPISEQVDLLPSLLSRFDLIFVMRDVPNEARDKAMAYHITGVHIEGEIIEQEAKHISPRQVADRLQVTPDLDPEMLRKYVAYARKNCVPLLTEGARQKVSDYYLKVRGLAKEGGAVPITARKLEDLVRLCEAAARMRLSNEVSDGDVDRVIALMDACLREVAYDAQTQTFDIDRVVTGVSKAQRDRIAFMRSYIKTCEQGGWANISNICDGLRETYSLDEVEAILDQMSRNNMIIINRGRVKLL